MLTNQMLKKLHLFLGEIKGEIKGEKLNVEKK